MVFRIGFVGLPSSGKTTAAKYLATQLYNNKVSLIHEFYRDYMEAKKGRIETGEEQIRCTIKQSEIENRGLITNPQFLITDTPLFIAEAYTKFYYPETILDATTKSLIKNHVYDIIFYCQGDTWQNDGIRFQTAEELAGLEATIKQTLDEHHKGVIIVLPIDKIDRRGFLTEWSLGQKHFYKQ